MSWFRPLPLASLAILTVTALAACGMEVDPPLLAGQRAEPPGEQCARGGTALLVGRDRDGDGVLAEAEIERIDYQCLDAPPATLVREDHVAPGADCARGGVAVHVGVDDDRDGILDDPEIDATTIACDPDEIWDGDLDADLDDPAIAAVLARVRIVTGSLRLGGTAVAMPRLELVGGGLAVTGNLPQLDLPRLTRVAGAVTIDTPGLDPVALPALEQVGGNFVVVGNGVHGTSIMAPALTRIGGQMVMAWGAKGALVMPALTTIDGDVRLASDLTALYLGGLLRIGGSLYVDDRTLTELRLPALRELAGTLEVHVASKLAVIDLPALGSLRDLNLNHTAALTDLRMPALSAITGSALIVGTPALEVVQLDALTSVATTLMVADAPRLGALGAPRLASVGEHLQLSNTGIVALDQPWLRTTGDVDVTLNPGLADVRLPALTAATRLNISDNPALRTIAVPALARATSITIAGSPRLDTLDAHALAQLDDYLDLRDADLPDLTGLRGLVSARALYLSKLRRIVDLRGLASLANVSFLRLVSDRALASLDGLERLQRIGGFVWISDAPALTSLRGLSGLVDVGSSVYLEGLGALPDLTGLEQLRVIGGTFTLRFAPRLTTLAPLANLGWVGEGVLIEFDDNLPPAEVSAFRARLAHGE